MNEKKMFVIIVKYIKPLEQVDEVVPAHVKFLEDCYERSEFICWGRQNPRVGGIILANVNSLDKGRKTPFCKTTYYNGPRNSDHELSL